MSHCFKSSIAIIIFCFINYCLSIIYLEFSQMIIDYYEVIIYYIKSQQSVIQTLVIQKILLIKDERVAKR